MIVGAQKTVFSALPCVFGVNGMHVHLGCKGEHSFACLCCVRACLISSGFISIYLTRPKQANEKKNALTPFQALCRPATFRSAVSQLLSTKSTFKGTETRGQFTQLSRPAPYLRASDDTAKRGWALKKVYLPVNSI